MPPRLIATPSRVQAAGEPAKLIDEYVGRVNTGHPEVSIAHMRSPAGWSEPGQRPAFDEFTVVLAGTLRVEFDKGEFEVTAGQAVHAGFGEWVRYSTPGPDGAEYVSICLPAFSPDGASRDKD
jgi:mannose-6-phosphate isomerase-like protein (cupin superfamily)